MEGITDLADLERIYPHAIPAEFYMSSLLRILTWCSFHIDEQLSPLLKALDVATQQLDGHLVQVASGFFTELTSADQVRWKLIDGVTVIFQSKKIETISHYLQQFLLQLTLPVLIYVLSYYLPQIAASTDWDECKYKRWCIDLLFGTS